MKYCVFVSVLAIVVNGLQLNEKRNRYARGVVADDHQFPWHASIMSCTKDACQFCGGSLISPRHVLTAAHCTRHASKFDISLGSNYYFKPVMKVTATKKIQHPDHDPSVWYNDVAIIVLPHDIQLSNYVQTIQLASNKADTLTNKRAFLSGFGRKNINDPPSPVLNMHDLNIISNDDCWKTWRYIIRSGSLCALEYPDDGQNVCHGDSGGPLVVWNGQFYTQVGISSFTSPVCDSKQPAGFARISHYIDWIVQNTGISVP